MSRTAISRGAARRGGAAGRNTSAKPMAAALLAQASRRWADAAWHADPEERFAGAYTAAQRAAAAVLDARGRPHRGRSRPTSVWTLLGSVAPELSDWAGYFADHSGSYAAVQAGITDRVTQRDADELLSRSRVFLATVRQTMGGYA
ncbi:SAV_6107 family HEPN domain-containing protein [Haloechinothrix sp. LS1_15]|uniref:SAV_6107 family HEPN domain-containing protein n=1 Tax=Haloechinothrix sp. LS1_15 TaxID=2652248 RepID=UPI00294885F3|nr:SAV_6107 family HEPN domain-containing protein [Haloechinothrix sp. LS1_15]MDV6014511.1 hypothetical protein [Haloechinothrix sp. LS1_15]